MFQYEPLIQAALAAILAALLASCIGLCIVPVAKKWGRRFGLVDQPDKKRKLHTNAVPLIGGIAIFLTLLITIPIFTLIIDYFFADENLSLAVFLNDRSLKGLFLASLVILCVGIIDDRINIRGRQKLLGQFVAATILIFFGYQFDIISVFGMDFIGANPIVYYAVAFAWILIGINSVNLLDGADGFAATIGAVTCIALCVMTTALALQQNPAPAGRSIEDFKKIALESDGMLRGTELLAKAKDLQVDDYAKSIKNSDKKIDDASAKEQAKAQQDKEILRSVHLRDAVICAIMAGAILAFLRFNFPPASAFLGDAGSMLIGLFIAAMAIKTGAKQATGYVFIAPIALLAIPLFDTLAAIVRRKLTGRSIYDTDRGHIHHVLIGKGFGPRKSLLLFFAMCLMTATGGTMALIEGKAAYAYLAILSVAIFLFVGRIFGIAEFKLISHGSSSMIRAVLPRGGSGQNESNHTSFRIQGTRDWEICWQVLREFAEEHPISQLSFDLNLPWIHESFHGKYKSSNRELLKDPWSLELPLLIEGRVIGRVNLQAPVMKANYSRISGELNAVLKSLEPHIALTMNENKTNVENDMDEFLAEQQSIEFGGLTAEAEDAGRN